MSLLDQHLSGHRFTAYYYSDSNPADNVSNSASPMTVAPPGLMRPGDFVYVHMYVGSAGPRTFSITNAGGQSWAALNGLQVGNIPEIYTTWCTFNGTWSANPQFAISGTVVAKSVVLHVFRPPTIGVTWAVDQAEAFQTTATSLSSTVTGITNTQPNNLTIASFVGSGSGMTYQSFSAGKWRNMQHPSNQWRNPTTNNKVSMYAYQTQGFGTAVGATGNVTMTALVSGEWFNIIGSFYYT